ncbi:MAG TPA: polyprenyl synthetase family protein [Myxococcaceae bacterium]|nr:polyprenyl synthetase family protein [Myxococcaceae bacterium]
MLSSHAAALSDYLAGCRSLVREEIERLVPRRGKHRLLYELMLEYPLREAKGMRPALCIAVCRGLGGRLHDVIPTAAVLELYHNAFLVHDDVEDGSRLRRGKPTLHQVQGIPVAINVGDGMLALALQPLLDNTERIGLGRALHALEIVARMCRESVEGQAVELEWIRSGEWALSDRDYLGMVLKKTGWYTFIAPVLLGAAVAGARSRSVTMLRRFATLLGVAFQIQDDLLNLEVTGAAYGKEIAGDLEEGKRTLIVLHLLRTLGRDEAARARAALALPREQKHPEELRWIAQRIREVGSDRYARAMADRYAGKARAALERVRDDLPPSPHREFIEALVEFTVRRAS